MSTLEYHTDPRGTPGYTVTVVGATQNYRTVIPAVALVDSTGTELGTAGNPLVTSGGGGGGGGAVTAALGSYAAGALVQLPTNLGPVTSANSLSITPASNATFSCSVAAGQVVSGAYADGAITTIGAIADAAYAGAGNASVISGLKGLYTAMVAATPAGANTIGSVIIATSNGGIGGGATNADAVAASSGLNFALNTRGFAYVFNGTTYDRAKKPNAVSRIVSSAATTNATVGKASAADVFGFEAYNTSATVKYLKIYNKASAPTVGTDTPIMTIALGPTSRTAMTFANPQYFATGLAYALTGAAADADTTALALGDVVALNINYQ